MTRKTFVYMNHRIRKAEPDGPVIVAQTGKRQVEGNRVDIIHNGEIVASVIYKPGGCPSLTHDVRAYVETKCQVRVGP